MSNIRRGTISNSNKEPELKYHTYEEYEAYLYKTYGVSIDNDVKKLNLTAVQQVFEGTEEVLKDFPNVQKVFGGLNTHNRGIMSVSPLGEVCYNPEHFETYNKAYNSCISEDNYHPNGSNVRSSGYHEAGHLLELSLIKRFNPDASIDKTIELYKKGTYANMIIKGACKRITSNKDYYALVEEVSRYAHKNYSECMAECVVDYYLNRANAKVLSREVVKELRRIINVN